MAFGLLIKKTSTAKGVIDIEYLDEFSNRKLEIKSLREGTPLTELKSHNNTLYASLNYMSKEEKGCVYAGGWVRNALLRKGGVSPENLDNEERKQLIHNAMKAQTDKWREYRGNHGHKLVFSLSNDLEDKLDAAKIDKEYELKRIFKRVMKDFEKQFHDRSKVSKYTNKKVSDKIGYAWGVHHDTDNLHIHCYLHNRTQFGHHVACSQPLKNRYDHKYRANQLGFIKQKLAEYEIKLEQKADLRIAQTEEIKQEKAANILQFANDFFFEKVDKIANPPKVFGKDPEHKKRVKMMNSEQKRIIALELQIKQIYQGGYAKGVLGGVLNPLILKDKKDKAALLRKEYYQALNKYNRNLESFIIEALDAHGMGKQGRDLYWKLVKEINYKRKEGFDFGEEVALMNKLRKTLNVHSVYNEKGFVQGRPQAVNSIEVSRKSTQDFKELVDVANGKQVPKKKGFVSKVKGLFGIKSEPPIENKVPENDIKKSSHIEPHQQEKNDIWDEQINDKFKHLEENIGKQETKNELIEMLKMSSKLHQYSFKNQMLIYLQAKEKGMDISMLNSFNNWKKTKCDHGMTQVMKGAKGFKVLVPSPSTIWKKDATGKFILNEKEDKIPEKNEDGTIKKDMAFSVGHVFDVSQTNALKLGWKPPEQKYKEEQKAITQEQYEEIKRRISKKFGIRIVESDDYLIDSRLNLDEKQIEILDKGKSPDEKLSVLFLELGHKIMYKDYREGQSEGFSYILSSMFGIEKDVELHIDKLVGNGQKVQDSLKHISENAKKAIKALKLEELTSGQNIRQRSKQKVRF